MAVRRIYMSLEELAKRQFVLFDTSALSDFFGDKDSLSIEETIERIEENHKHILSSKK